jgi:hypothetical protein
LFIQKLPALTEKEVRRLGKNHFPPVRITCSEIL